MISSYVNLCKYTNTHAHLIACENACVCGLMMKKKGKGKKNKTERTVYNICLRRKRNSPPDRQRVFISYLQENRCVRLQDLRQAAEGNRSVHLTTPRAHRWLLWTSHFPPNQTRSLLFFRDCPRTPRILQSHMLPSHSVVIVIPH